METTVVIFVPVWKRPEITEICFMGINRLKKVEGFKVSGFAVLSEDSMIPLCEKHGIDWCMTANNPLGAKKNFGLRELMKKKDFDYMIEIGSDDLLKNEVLTQWDSKVVGLMDFALIDTQTGRCKVVRSRIPKWGAGRAFHRSVLQGNLWEDSRNKGLDNSSCRIMAKNGVMQHGRKFDNPVAVALKSDTNIWRYKLVPGEKYEIENALSGLSTEEITAIKSLYATA